MIARTGFQLVESQAVHWIGLLERFECSKGAKKSTARRVVAERLGVSHSTLDNIARGRAKGIRGWIIDRVRVGVINTLEKQIAGLTHELDCARLAAPVDDLCADDVEATLARLGEAREIVAQLRARGI